MKPVCPFAKVARPDDGSLKKPSGNKQHPACEAKSKPESTESATISPKCPLGYDSESFKIGPFSCMICKALLFECSKCVPCSHVYCKACISRFNDCPLCGADIESTEPDTNLQSVVDRFIEGHARIKRQVDTEGNEVVGEKKTVIYEDVSLERGTFLVQHAMRAFRANNVESAKSRLNLCAEDVREQLERSGNTSELCSQLGAVLGMLGDCCRATGDATSAVSHFEESVNFLSKLSADDLEVGRGISSSAQLTDKIQCENMRRRLIHPIRRGGGSSISRRAKRKRCNADSWVDKKKRRRLNYLIAKLVPNRNRILSNNDFLVVKTDQHITTGTVQIGDTLLNLSRLLFTKKRNYLINYKQNKQISTIAVSELSIGLL